jgi:hypothetical protein
VKRIFPIFNAVIAITAGVIVLFGYFINISGLDAFRSLLLKWAILLAGMAVIVGAFNLFFVHLQKIRQQRPGAVYSVVLLVFFMMTFLIVIVLGVSNGSGELGVVLKTGQDVLLNGIMVPTEISLLAILAVTLIYASVRLLRWRLDLKTILFVVTGLLVLLSTGPWPFIGQVPFVGGFIQTFAAGGARGILIGVALGTLTTGLRILFGADRPYGGK